MISLAHEKRKPAGTHDNYASQRRSGKQVEKGDIKSKIDCTLH